MFNQIKMKFLALFLILFLYLPGIRDFYKFDLTGFPLLVFAIYLICIFLILNLVSGNKNNIYRQSLSSPLTIILMLFIMGMVTFYFYPQADSRKIIMMGSDQDDCIISGVTQLLQFSHPYVIKTYLNNPCSPGLGALLLFLPFILIKSYIAGSIFYIYALCLILYLIDRQLKTLGLFIFFLCTAIIFPELLVDGSDLIAISCGVAIISICLYPAIKKQDWILILFLSLFCGLLSSARVNFLILTPILGLLIYPNWPKGSIYFSIIAAIVGFAPNAMLYISDPSLFTPLHLVQKGTSLLSIDLMVAVLILTFFGLLYGIKKIKESPKNMPYAIFICLLPSFASLAISDLYFRGGDIGNWYGANYIIPIFPLAAILVARILTERSEA
jgi:hypothetical protein